jgi:hypothetical protein
MKHINVAVHDAVSPGTVILWKGIDMIYAGPIVDMPKSTGCDTATLNPKTADEFASVGRVGTIEYFN